MLSFDISYLFIFSFACLLAAFYIQSMYTFIVCRSLLILFARRALQRGKKLCEALQSFSGWYIAFYIGVDQGRQRDESCLLKKHRVVVPNFIKREDYYCRKAH